MDKFKQPSFKDYYFVRVKDISLKKPLIQKLLNSTGTIQDSLIADICYNNEENFFYVRPEVTIPPNQKLAQREIKVFWHIMHIYWRLDYLHISIDLLVYFQDLFNFGIFFNQYFLKNEKSSHSISSYQFCIIL